MVGRPERRPGYEWSPWGQEPRDRVDARDLERLLAGERRQDPGQAAREHRLAGARRPTEQQVVPTRRGQLQRPPRPFLAMDVGKVLQAARRGQLGRLLERLRLPLAAEVRRRLGEVV